MKPRAQPRAIRFLVPEGRTAFQDLVHGEIDFDRAHLEDFVILRRDSHPTYHLSVVVDDVAMEVTHVVRGDDHISNTPKQVLLYEAMGAPVPLFAHVPLILGADKKRLSKRHGATAVGEYEKQGYLPEAMVNFLALLGWSPGGNDEVFSKDELVGAFLARGHQRRERGLQSREARLVQPAAHHAAAGAGDPAAPGRRVCRRRARRSRGWTPARLEQIIDLLKPRARKLTDIVAQVAPVSGRQRRLRPGGRGEASLRSRAAPAL